jgi:serine phosphatase RsbU (regulator of sigma subunit)
MVPGEAYLLAWAAVSFSPYTPTPQDEAISVLLVEDDPGDALLTRELLDGSGFMFSVRPAKRLADAMSYLRSGVDCVLLDLGLPDAGGLDALDGILNAAPGTAVIVLTGRADRDLALAAVARGAQDYLQKGELDGELLSRAVRYAVQRKRSEEAARRLLAKELQTAESARLERGLLARPMLEKAGLVSAARYRSGGGSLLLGGDFYDAIELPDGSVRVVIGDVSGHGPDEAAIGVALRIAWRGFVLAGLGPERVLEYMQAVLDAERLHDTLFATVCDATIAPDRSAVTLRVAGHPAPVLMSRPGPSTGGPGPSTGGQGPSTDGPGPSTDGPGPLGAPGPAVLGELPVVPGLPLGILDGAAWPAQVFPLSGQWALIFYTDGIIEGRSRHERSVRLGLNGLLDGLRASPAATENLGVLADELLAIAEGHNGGPVADDIALFLVAPAVG